MAILRFFLVAAVISLTSTALSSQTSRLPVLQTILDKNVQAMGGREALANPLTLLLSGDCDSSAPEESGPVEIAVKSPKVYLRLGDDNNLQMGFTGDVVWRHASTEDLQKKPGRNRAELLTVFDPARVLYWRAWYPDMKVTGTAKVYGHDTYILETGGATTEKIFVDQRSGLVLRDEVTPKFVFDFADYRAVDGVQLPALVTEATPSGIVYTYHLTNATRVPETDESRFQPR